MKLYFTKGACSFAVRIIINELDLTAEFESVDLKNKKTNTGDDFWKINPKGAVPTLVTNDKETLTENAVILQYLADSNNATELLPAINDFKRYRVLEWVNFITTELHKSFALLFNPKLPQDVKDNIIIPLIKTKFSFVDTHLKNNKFLMGDHFTLGDAYLFVMLMWAMNFKIAIADFSNLSGYFAALKNRASIAKSLQEENILLK